MWSNPRHVIVCTAACLLVALLLVASTEERANMSTLQLRHEPMTILSSASHTPAGIHEGLDASGVAQTMLDARLLLYKALRSGHQPKSTLEEIEIKITGDLHAANLRRDELLVNRNVFSTLSPTSIRVGYRLDSQAPESIEPERTSRQAQRLAGSVPLCRHSAVPRAS